MGKYRIRSTEVEAFQTRHYREGEEPTDFLEWAEENGFPYIGISNGVILVLSGLEQRTIHPGQYILKDESGDFFVMGKDHFHELYVSLEA